MIVDIAVPLASGACGLMALASGFRATAGTTLRAPWWWAAVSLSLIAVGEAVIAMLYAGETAGAAQFRLAAAATAFCPLVALFGAKRPQDRAWQFIVLSFWVVLALPAAQAWLLRPEESPTIHSLWGWFRVALLVVGCTNFLLTRFWLASLLTVAGQTALNWPYLPFGSQAALAAMPLSGLGLLAAAAFAAALAGRVPRRAGNPLDNLWLDFRDQFGVVWALRMLERFNASSEIQDSALRLGWHGFTEGGSPVCLISPAVTAETENSLRTLLRRFVSMDWIDRRLGGRHASNPRSPETAGVPAASEA